MMFSKLALVFVDALDLDVEQRRRVDLDAHALAHRIGQPLLVGPLHGGEFLAENRVVGKPVDLLQGFEIVHEAIADGRADQLRQALVALEQPAALGDAVGLVVDALGIERVQVGEDRLLHQLRVQRRDAVDGMRAGEGQIAHAHAPLAVLADQRDAG